MSLQALSVAREQFALQVAYACAIGNGDAHLKNFAVTYRHPEDVVALAPAYDIVSTLPYLPRDTLALTLGGSKAFPDRKRLLTFVRHVTGKTGDAAGDLLRQVAVGVRKAREFTSEFGRQHKDARQFAERLDGALAKGLGRIKRGD